MRSFVKVNFVCMVVFCGSSLVADPHSSTHSHASTHKHDTTHKHSSTKSHSSYTLIQVMHHLGAAAQDIQWGLLTNNRLMIKSGATRIEDHPKPKGGIKPYIKKNIAALGAMIKKVDAQVHGAASAIAKKAEKGTMIELQMLNNDMVKGCIQCHNIFRD